MANTVDLALLAGAAYFSTRTGINRFPIPTSWSERLQNRDTDDQTGFEARAFQSGSEIVISFSGTDPNNAGLFTSPDGITNRFLAAGYMADQLMQAAEYYLQVKAASPVGAVITLTGHSLGGGLAALVGVFFGVRATTFDQAPFARSALDQNDNNAQLLLSRLAAKLGTNGQRLYDTDALAGLAEYLQLRSAGPIGFIPREGLIDTIRVQGEFLDGGLLGNLPFGNAPTLIDHGPGASSFELHSQALLSAFLQSQASAAGAGNPTQTLSEVSKKLTSLLPMLFVSNKLFNFNVNDAVNNNFLDHLVRHESGVRDPVSGTTIIAADQMVTRFTADLWTLAKDNGLTLTDGNASNPDLHDVSKALTAFAMQMYYEDTANATDQNKQLFTEVTGGIQFDIADVSKKFAAAFAASEKLDLKDAKGFELYFKNYLASSSFTGSERQLIASILPYMRDWYVQAGNNGLAYTDIQNRGAFMLGGNASDALVGGTGADLLVGNAGNDLLMGGKGNDTLMGGKGNDTYIFQTADGLDTLLDSDGIGSIVSDGSTLTGGAQYGDNRVYRSADKKHLYVLANNNTLLIDGQIVVEGYNKTRGDLGLNYTDAPTQSNPSTSKDIKGDLKPLDTNLVADGVQATLDDIGNIVTTAQADPDRADTLNDSTANDRITSGGGNDNIYLTRGGDNWVEAGSGRDWVRGGAGKDLIEGGADADILQGGAGDDRLYAGSQSTVAQAIADGNTQSGTGLQGDWLAGNAGDDIGVGSNANDVLTGGGGNDLLIAGAGNDFVFGDVDWMPTSLGWGVTNTLLFQPVTGQVHPTDYGADVIFAGAGNDFAWGGRGNDVLFGEAGDDNLLGNGDNDALFGGAGKDTLSGDSVDQGGDIEANMGDDYLDGGTDDDLLYGGAGSDILIGGTGDDTLYGGEGQDIYIFNKGDGSDTIIDNKSDNNTIRFGEGVLSSDITLRLGSLMLDMGNGDAVHIEGFNRNDVYNSSGINSLEFADGSALNTTELLARGFDLDGTGQDDVIWATNIADRIQSFDGDDVLIGGAGDDTIRAGAGNDQMWGDDITVALSGFVIDPATHGKDMLEGGTGDDQIIGGGNNDQIFGGDGDDVLAGDGEGLALMFQGDDYLDGGAGDDLLRGDGGSDALFGGVGNDLLEGGTGDDVLDGGAGTNLLQGGAGNDRYVLNAANATAVVDPVTGSTTMDTTIDDAEGQNTLQIDASLADMTVVAGAGGAGVGITWGNSGVAGVYLQGVLAAGAFKVELADGTKTTLRKLAATTLDTAVESTSYDEGATLFGGKQADTLVAYGSNSTVSGGLGDDSITMLYNYGTTVEYARGDGVDTLGGYNNGYAAGAVIALSGDFNLNDFRLEVNASQQLSVVLGAGEGDRMNLGIDLASLDNRYRLIECFTLPDGQSLSFADLVARGVKVTGSEQDDYLQGTSVSDTVYTLAGNDTLDAGAGNDTIYVGAGNKQLWGGAGDDTYIIGSGNAIPSNSLIDDNDGASVIRLAAITDWQNVTLLQPVAGSNDLVFALGTGTDTVTLVNGLLRADKFNLELVNAQGATETRSLRTFMPGLGALAVAGGDDADVMVGSDQADVLSGGEGNNQLSGGAGNDLLLGGSGQDLLAGGMGDDVLLGGEGNDTYVIEANGGNDQIFDYSGTNAIRFLAGITPEQISVERLDDSTDIRLRIDANNSVVIRRGLEGAVNSYAFADGSTWSYTDVINRAASVDGQIIAGDDIDNAIEGTAGADLLLGNRGNDVLRGHNGNDELLGGDEDDDLIGGSGDDALNGGAGVDTYRFALGDGVDNLLDTDGNSVISFGAGIALANLSASRVTLEGIDYMRLAYSANDAVLIKEGVLLPDEAFKFADGTTLSQAQVYAEALADSVSAAPYTEQADVIYGYAGDDVLAGGGGGDALLGGKGDDVLDGGDDNDTLTGGVGHDTYVMGLNGGRDTLVDTSVDGSVVQLSQGDSSSLSYARVGKNLLVSSAALNSSFYITDFYRNTGSWTLKTATGQELDLRALAVAGMQDKSTEQRREDFYAGLLTKRQPVYLGTGLTLENEYSWGDEGVFFATPGEKTKTYNSGIEVMTMNGWIPHITWVNQMNYSLNSHVRHVTQFDDATLAVSGDWLNTTWIKTLLETIHYADSYDVTYTAYATSFTTKPGRSIEITSLPPGFAFETVPGSSIYRAPDGRVFINEPSTTTVTSTPYIATYTVPSSPDKNLYSTNVTGTLVIEDVRAGDQANTIVLDGSASKLVVAGGGDDVVTRLAAPVFGDLHYYDAVPRDDEQGLGDWVDGGAGDDTILLGSGNDEISGGMGSDYLDGGVGGDRYEVSADDDGWDTINEQATTTIRVVYQVPGWLWWASEYQKVLTDLNRIMFNVAEGGQEGIYAYAGYVLATPENLNELLRIDQMRRAADQVDFNYGDGYDPDLGYIGRTSFRSPGLDQFIANLTNVPVPEFLFELDVDMYRPEANRDDYVRPQVVFTDDNVLDYLGQAVDVVNFGSGITQSTLQIAWGQVELAEGTKDTLLLSWGGQGGIKVVMPDVGAEFGRGIELFEFADGSSLSMQQMLALAPPRNQANSVAMGVAIPVLTATEDHALSFTIPTDAFVLAGNKTARYSATLADTGEPLPEWLHLDALTGELTGTPANDHVGNIAITVTARLTAQKSASQTFTLNVANTNDAPEVVGVVDNVSATAGQAFSWALPTGVFMDQDVGDRLSYRVEGAAGAGLPAWLKFNFITGKLEGTPTNAYAGLLNLQLVATDLAGAQAFQAFSIDVQSTNSSPTVVNPVLTQNTHEDAVWRFTVPANTFEDVDAGDTLVLSAALANGEPLPVWLSFDAATQTFSGTPPDTASGLLTINVTATDPLGAAASTSFDLNIADIIKGTALDDVLLGTTGNDFIQGGLGADRMTGGMGNDVYYVDNALDKVIEKTNEGLDTVHSTVTHTLAANVEDLVLDGAAAIDGTGNALDNRIEGNAADNKLMGGAGNDTLLGGAGDDWLRGGTGSDTLVGGMGDDLYEVDNTGDVVVENLNEGVDTVESSVAYSLSAHIENLILAGTLAIDGTGNELDNTLQGNDAANTLTGDAGNDTLNGKKGLDTLTGGLGNDTYLLEDDVDTVLELVDEGRDTVISRYALTLAENIEDGMLLGSAASITGNALSNVLTGSTAANTLDGGAGADVMLGGKGNDTYIVDSQADTVVENAGEGTDTVQSSVNYALADNLEHLTLTGSAEAGMGNEVNNKLTGNTASNKLFGGAGSDDLDGGEGADILIGGLGNDEYWVDSASDLVVESAAEGTDTVYASVSYALADNVERLVLTGSANINAVGNAGNNRLEGSAGNNILFGGLGNDTYVFGRGSGHDIVANFDAGKPSGDMVQLGAGIADADLSYVRLGNDLVLNINGTTDQLTVAGYFENAGKGANALEKIRFADGTSLNHAAVLSRATVDAGVSEAPGIPAAVRAGDPTSLFDAPVAAATKTSDAAITPQSVAESINQARERFEQGLQNLKLGIDEQGSLSRSEFAERRALPLLWNLQDALLNLQLAKNTDGRFTADVSIDSRATRDLGLGINLLGATNGMTGRLDQVARPSEVQQFDLAQLH